MPDAAAPKSSAGERPLIWISWIGGALCLILALLITHLVLRIVLLAVGVAVLVVAIAVTTRRVRRRRADEPGGATAP
ncbi:hypothetical protein [Brevibacterium oceani]|uniref:hypothetical protein n=1 Tax=Brevibacterium oceani TaxID=358099 RepID=UPI0015E72A7C|nr:hypothetical protein [Brevibacterium oceani]